MGLHKKPIVLLNISGYWDPLIDLLNSIIDRGFADASLLDFVKVVPSVPEMIAALK